MYWQALSETNPKSSRVWSINFFLPFIILFFLHYYLIIFNYITLSSDKFLIWGHSLPLFGPYCCETHTKTTNRKMRSQGWNPKGTRYEHLMQEKIWSIGDLPSRSRFQAPRFTVSHAQSSRYFLFSSFSFFFLPTWIDEQNIEDVHQFLYLGGVGSTDGRIQFNVTPRITSVCSTLTVLSKI